MNFALSILLLILVYAACGIAAGTVQRSLGLISIGHASVLGSGAYAYALTTTAGAAPGVGALAALGIGVAAGAALVAFAGRVRGESYALVTFGIQIVWLGMVSNLDVVGGALGIPRIPGPDTLPLILMTAVLGLAAAIAYSRLNGTALAAAYAVVGRGMELARAFGIPVIPLLILQGAVYGAILGLSGAVLAAYISFIDPSLFGVGISVSILAIGFFTVARGVVGGVLGAVLLVGLPQLMRLVGLSSSFAGYVQVALSGLALLAVASLWIGRPSQP